MYRSIATVAAGLALLTAAPAQAQVLTNPEEAAIRATLEHYLAGHATGDPREFRQAFHDEAQRRRWIESIDITGSAASAKIVLDHPTAVLTDYVQLLKTPEGWKIVNKIFDVKPKPRS